MQQPVIDIEQIVSQFSSWIGVDAKLLADLTAEFAPLMSQLAATTEGGVTDADVAKIQQQIKLIVANEALITNAEARERLVAVFNFATGAAVAAVNGTVNALISKHT